MFKYVVGFFVCILFNLSAQNADDAIKSLQNKFNTIKDMSASFKQGNMSGTIYYKKENMYRIELSNLTLISDGKTTWSYTKKENKVIVNDYDEATSSMFSFNSIIRDYPSKCNSTSTKEGSSTVILLTPKPKVNIGFTSAKIWVNNENLVQKIVIEKGKNPLQISLSNYKINQNLSNSHFSFTPPKGSKIIDLR